MFKSSFLSSRLITMFVLTLTVYSVYSNALAAQPSLEEKIDILQKEIEELKAQVAQQVNAQGAASAAGTTNVSNNTSLADNGTSTTLGGYGEVTYNHYRNTSANDSQADLRRFVLFFGHRFNDRLSFKSELEVEHAVASADDSGEVEVEQAYIDYRVNEGVNMKAGLFLIPLGILNETHEPPTYYGVERNEVETRIIPSTWREGGIGLYGEMAPGWKYDVGLTTGFNTGKIDDPATGFRSGHQELQQSKANDLSVYAALNYRGMPGLLLGGGVFSGDTSQKGASLTDPTAKALLASTGARLTLWDMHGKYTAGNLELQGLYAKGTLSGADTVAAAILAEQLVTDPLATGVAVPKSIYGWYGQAAYHVWRQGDFDLAPFVRYEKFNTQQNVAAGFAANPLNDERVVTTGINFKLHPQVVLKADYQKFKADSGKNRLNLGMGYMF
jgi:uncharacterized small protein (DUF1192 family)